MSHRTLVTSTGTLINHWHRDAVEGELTDDEKASFQASYLAGYPGISAVQYVHLDHTSEELGPTRKYNCWGFTFNPRQCWISTGTDVQHILDDNGTQVFPPNVRVGDVICYRNSSGVITHTGRVWSLDAASNPALIQSKWGQMGEYYHPPLTVPASYGTNVSYWRVVPISGRGEAWMKDFPGDDRNAAPPGIDLYLSPDLWVNNSGGTFHENPTRHQPNQLWVRVHNPDTLAIVNAQVHVYWSNPTGGMPHTEWHLIGTVAVSVPPGPGTEATGSLTWTPGDAEPQHCCLFAIADTGTDWWAPATLDPIVWPFDVARDNSIVWKNCWIEETNAPPPGGGSAKPLNLEFVARNPLHITAPLEVRVRVKQITPDEILGMGLDPKLAKRAARSLEQAPKPTRWPFLGRPPIFGGKPRIGVSVRTGDGWRKAGGVVAERGLVLTMPQVRPGKGDSLRLEVRALDTARPGEVYRVDLRQRVGGQATGGAVYVIVVR